MFALQRNKALLPYNFVFLTVCTLHSDNARERLCVIIDSCSWDSLAFLRTPSTWTDNLIKTIVACAYLTNNSTREIEVLHALRSRTLMLMPFRPSLKLGESVTVTALRTRPLRLMRKLAFPKGVHFPTEFSCIHGK